MAARAMRRPLQQSRGMVLALGLVEMGFRDNQDISMIGEGWNLVIDWK